MKDEIDGSSEKSTLTGIRGVGNDSIDIPTQILQEINSTGMCIYVYVHIHVHVHIKAAHFPKWLPWDLFYFVALSLRKRSKITSGMYNS